MKNEKIIKTVRQHSKSLPDEAMSFLRGIAGDYAKIKAYVFSRYSGIESLKKIYPGYDVLNELIALGIRNDLNLPHDYFACAVFDALGDIKSMWSNLKIKLIPIVNQNEGLTDEDRHYIFSILKQDKLLSAVLSRQNPESNRLNNLIRRYVRKYRIQPSVNNKESYFQAGNRAYRYKDGGIYLTSRVPYQRVFIPLTDNAAYNKQLTIKVFENTIEIIAPVEVKPKIHAEYTNKITLTPGNKVMLTSSTGGVYGKELGALISERTSRIYQKRRERGRHYGIYNRRIKEGDNRGAEKVRANNLGLKKLLSQNSRELETIKSYINRELNRMLKEEKPSEITITTGPKQKPSHWTIGYIKKRLSDKCAANGIKLIGT